MKLEGEPKMKQFQLFLAFFRVGILGFGGGPSSIPLVHKEVVEKYKWMDTDDFGDVLALGNALPGPINTKMAGYIGYRVGGLLGMVIALFATVFPTVILMILLLTALNAYKDEPWVNGMVRAVVPVVAVMLATLTWDFIKKSTKSTLGWGWTIAFLIGSLILLQLVQIHPAILIFVLLVAALLKKDGTDAKKEKKTS
jgi:chromate transporter